MDNCTLTDDVSARNNERQEDHVNEFVHDSNQLCRLCAQHTENVTFIFEEPGIEQKLALKINAYLPVSVNKSDALPKQLCMICLNKLHIISEFAQNCLHAEELLRRSMEPKILKSKGIKSELSLLNKDANAVVDANRTPCPSFNSITKLYSVKNKPMLLMSNNSILPCPHCCNGKMNTIEEPEKFVENTFTEKFQCNEQHMDRQNPEQQNNIVSSNFHSPVELLEPNNGAVLHNELACTNEKGDRKIVNVPKINFHTDKSHELGSPVQHNENEIQDSQRSSNKVNQVVLCQLCSKTFPSIDTCIDHCKGHFSSQDTCHICHYQFDSEQNWNNHLREHILCTQLQVHDHYLCQDCNQLFTTLTAFSVHGCPCKQYDKSDKEENHIATDTSVALHNETDSCGTHSSSNHNQQPLITGECQSNYGMKEEKSEFSCQYCMEIFNKKSDYTSHVQTAHSDIPQYVCEVCDEKFQNQFVLQYHYASHMNLTSLQCIICGLTFPTQISLHQHLLSHHPNVLPPHPCYKCNTCQETYTNLNDSVTHISTHLPNSYEQNHEIEEVHTSQLYMCEYCESCFILKSLLYEHYSTHSKDNRYVCKICSTTFTSYGRLSKHKLLHNEQNQTNVNNSTDISTVVKLFVCQECEKCYTQWNSLNNHRRNCHQNSHLYTCKICNESFIVYAEYQDHRKIHPAQVKCEAEGNEKEYLCEYCHKTFHHHSTLALHQRIHLKGQPYACEICGETFRLKSTYDKHFRKHTGIKPYICDVCGKGFTQNSGLYTHRRVHTGEKPYACDLCGKNFRLKHDRDNHRRCHTGERPYQCTYCGKAFRTSHDHRQHLLIHTGQRPYRCDYCNKGFRRINGLNVHKRIHTGEKPYGCAICGRHFTQKGDMMKHCKTQHGNTF